VKKIATLNKATQGLEKYLEETLPQNRSWENFRNFPGYENADGHRAHRELMLALSKQQHGLCAYCEIELKEADRQIEHFHPKSKNKDRAFDVSNLLVACKGGEDFVNRLEPIKENLSCGAFHGNEELQDDQHPFHLPAMPSIFLAHLEIDKVVIRVDGKACENTAILTEQAEAMLSCFNLNCTRLRNARFEIWKKLEEDLLQLWEEGKSDDEAFSELAGVYLLPDNSGKLPPFFTTRRSFLGESAEELLRNHPEGWI